MEHVEKKDEWFFKKLLSLLIYNFNFIGKNKYVTLFKKSKYSLRSPKFPNGLRLERKIFNEAKNSHLSPTFLDRTKKFLMISNVSQRARDESENFQRSLTVSYRVKKLPTVLNEFIELPYNDLIFSFFPVYFYQQP